MQKVFYDCSVLLPCLNIKHLYKPHTPRPEDQGVYRCTAINEAGSYEQRVQLLVQSAPVISMQADYATAALGTPASLNCAAAGTPEPVISWVKENGDLPSDHDVTPEGSLDLYDKISIEKLFSLR